jgi:predicted TIM-barrel fold metal-dependent hydrolase
MEFFDCNARYGIFSVPPNKRADTVDDLVNEMKWCGIQRAMVQHVAMVDESPIVGNPLLIEQIGGYANLEPSWAILPPQTRELGTVAQFISAMGKNGVKALWAYPSEHKYLLNGTTFGELFEEMIARGIPLFVQRKVASGGLQGWAVVESVLRDFPKLTMALVGHGSWGEDRYFRPMIERYENLYVDMSRYELDGGIADFCGTYGPDRMLFGTNFPNTPMGGPMLTLMHADISDDEKEAVAGGNLRRILAGVKL